MWFVLEGAGFVCMCITYAVVLIVEITLLRVGIWERILAGDVWAYGHLAVFQYHVCLIFASHIKCMTTQPGILPLNVDALNF
jgi:hypothetical protein